MTVIGVGFDLSFDHPSGYYIFKDGEPVQGGLIKSTDGKTVDSMVDAVSEFMTNLYAAGNINWLAIEGVYLAQYRSARGAVQSNVTVLEHLVDLRAPIMTDARRMGIEPRFIGTTYDIDEACGIDHFIKRPVRKASTKRFAKQLTGLELPEDVADACAIAFWGHTKYKQYLWLLQES